MVAQHRSQHLFLLFALVFGATASGQPPQTFAKVAAGGVALNVPSIKGYRFPTEQESGIVFAANGNLLNAFKTMDGFLQFPHQSSKVNNFKESREKCL